MTHKSPKEFTKKPLKLKSKLGKFLKYRINIQKLIAFLYTRNTQREMKKFKFHL